MKSKTKYFSLFAMITVLALTLTGCANNGHSIYQAPTSGPYAWIFSLFGKPIQNIMLAVEHQIGGSNGAGWAIIIITFLHSRIINFVDRYNVVWGARACKLILILVTIDYIFKLRNVFHIKN